MPDLFVTLFALCFFPGLIAFAGSMDLFTMTIPNKISIALVAGFLVFAPLSGLGLYDIGWHLACGAIVLCVTVFMFAMGWMGGGDAKIFATISLWLGFGYVGNFLIIAAIAGGVLTLALMMFRKYPLPQALLNESWLARLHHPKEGVPYGISIAFGALFVYPSTPWILGTIS